MLALAGNLPAMEARRTRRTLSLRPDLRISPLQAYDLALAETGDVEQAEAAHYAAALAQVQEAQARDIPET